MPIRYIKVDSKYDLLAYIGWLYSNSIDKIERVDYMETTEDAVEKNDIIHFDRSMCK